MSRELPPPALPGHIEAAIDNGQWNPELSREADQAIAQWDARVTAEFPLKLRQQKGGK